ncbi:MAG TPA: OmpA family protein [Opitutaceae bacterium]|nr:OmpA family protein [Opitutaceae bacterium]
MNLLSKKLTYILLGAALAFAGCSKKPKRPSPNDTLLGQGGAGSGIGGLDPSASNIDTAGLTDPTAGGLSDRGMGTEIGDQLRDLFQPVYFDFDASAIKGSERSKLQEAQGYLNQHPEARILLEGHCDWKGTAEYNLGLGDRRANAAKQYLQSLGVAPTRIETLSKGDLDAVENASADQAAKDRRVDLVILKK